ncbi:MAG: hypothetical protein IKQ35_03100 [Bacilli bacterium]|nr:hypothetical protein [Bacilli bacterium]
MDNNLDFLEPKTNLFKEVDAERREQERLNNPTNEEFINGLPDWDLVPPYESVRRVNRQ